jgi:putative endonuclease
VKRDADAGREASAYQPWRLYVLECADGTLYVGIAKDVARRLACHESGRGARYTRTRRPVRLVYSEPAGDHASALRRERRVKRWSRPGKVERLGLAVPRRLGPPAAAGAGSAA